MANTHNEVAHAWAHKTGRKTKGFNIFYDGETIYSYGYHFAIARHISLTAGDFILFTKAGYSVSTAKHKTYVRRAIGYNATNVIEVPDVGAFNVMDGERRETLLKQAAEQAFDAMLPPLEAIALKWKRAKKYRDGHARDLAREIDNLERLAQAFNIDRLAPAMPEDIAEYAAALEERAATAAKAQDAKDKEAIRKWLAFETDNAPHTRVPFVRVKDSNVQTSWGVTVPLADALPLFQKANECKETATAWNGFPPMTVGGYQVKGIDAHGTLTVGCHVIPLRVQREAARLAGIA